MDIEQEVLRANSFSAFNPMQLSALKKNPFENSLVVSSPTASGKTIIAELAALNSIINKKLKAVYTCPLRALASEHYNDFKRKYSKQLNIRMTISTGDFDSSSPYLQNYDLIFTTYEKLDSLIRHKADWLSSIGLLIIDEIHELDSDRGPTLEILITKMRLMNPKLQLLALSATIPNSNKLAEWLDAKHVESDFRPVKLREGVYFNEEIFFDEIGKEKETVDHYKEPLHSIAKNTLEEKGKQALVFANTRKRAENIAKQLSALTSSALSPKEKSHLQNESEKILNALEQPTEQCKALAELVKNGVSFHHAGLLQKQRTIVEDLFRENYLKIISATPTLCLAKGTEVWCNSAFNAVESLQSSDKVLALSGNSFLALKPKAIVENQNTSKLLELSTVSGFSVILTPNHRILIKRNKRKILVESSDCRKGDKIATAGVLPTTKDRILKFSDVLTNKKLSTDFILDENTFYFIGAMFGDGYSGAETKNGKIIFKGSPCIVGKDNEIFKAVCKFCKKHKIHFSRIKDYYGTPVIRLSKSKLFREFLLSCGVEKGEHKYIPNLFFSVSNQNTAALLRGLFDTDGYVQSGKDIGFSNISKHLIFGIKKLLLRFGIVSRMRKRPTNTIRINNKTYKTKRHYEITISQKLCIKKFSEFIGFSVKRKQKALQSIIDKINSNIHFAHCKKCNYQIYADLFSGRTVEQKLWGKQKLKIIKHLGKFGAAYSNKLQKILGVMPYNGEYRLNHHFELISRTRFGNKKLWGLNKIGKFIYRNYLKKGKDIRCFFEYKNCPHCNTKLVLKLKDGWRGTDFDGDIFWDILRRVKQAALSSNKVYDVVLPDKPHNDHLLVANGVIVHNSAGVNLPAYRVIIPSLYRYTEYGNQRIPVREYKQFAGRAGRPKYHDKFGESILIAKSDAEKDEMFESYINGEIEEITSKLGFEPILRTHVLAAIAGNFIFDLQSLEQFFSKTFYAKQYGNLKELFVKIQEIIEELKDYGFVEADEKKMLATRLGKRVSELYLDPVSAHKIILALMQDRTAKEIYYLYALANTSEFYPLISAKGAAQAEIWEKVEEAKTQLPVDVEKEQFYDQDIVKKFSTALLLNDWIDEIPEQTLAKSYNVLPGILHSKIEKADWLLYSSFELARLLEKKNHLPKLSRLRKRIKYGVREELLALCELRYIGRVRSRRLWANNVRGIADVKKASLEQLGRILGEGVALKVKAQFGQKK